MKKLLLAAAVVLVGMTSTASVTAQATPDEVRIEARKLDSGGVQVRLDVDGEKWQPAVFPYEAATVGQWLRSAPYSLRLPGGDSQDLRIEARKLGSGKIEFRLDIDGETWEPTHRFFPYEATAVGRWLRSSPYEVPSAPPPEPDVDDDALTRAYVQAGIAFYEANGRDATVAYYNSPASIEGERSLLILQEGDLTIVASSLFTRHIGTNSFTAPGTPMGAFLQQATPEGYSFESFYLNPSTLQQEPASYFAVLHDGLVIVSAHSIVREDAAAAAQDYVRKATNRYDQEGLDATVAYYDTLASVDGQFYLFLIDENDLYIAHPIFPSLKGTDIKNVTDAAGFNLGKEIAKATEAGHWVDYLWLNPASGREENKSAWVIRHDGIIFASGYYTPDPDVQQPVWLDADPREYTVTYVDQAIARYERDGRDGLVNYYNSVISFDGQWYLFAMDADDNDNYILHPIRSDLIGTDIKKVTDSDGKELGKEIAAATGEGVWVDYQWPHPFTKQDAPKVAYAKLHDGLIFASGYYVNPDDPRAYTKQYVAEAIAYYDREGREAAIKYYNSSKSIEFGLWRLNIYDDNGTVLTEPVHPHRVGTTGKKVLELGVTPEGQWVKGPAFNPLAPELNVLHRWFVLHDGLIFQSSYAASE